MTTTTELIEIRQLPIIAERLHEIKDEIERRAAGLAALDCTEDTKAEVKAARAEFRKDFDELEKQRKAVKAAVLAPYEEFDKVYKECVTEPFNKADSACTAKIKAVEDEQISAKRKTVEEHFAARIAETGYDFITLDKIGLKINLSAKPKALCDEIDAFIADVTKNINTIKLMDDKIRDGVMAAYVQMLDLGAALRRENAQRQAAKEAEKLTAAPKQEVSEEEALFEDAFLDEEPVFEDFTEEITIRFTVTPDEKLRLMQMIAGFDYEEVQK